MAIELIATSSADLCLIEVAWLPRRTQVWVVPDQGEQTPFGLTAFTARLWGSRGNRYWAASSPFRDGEMNEQTALN